MGLFDSFRTDSKTSSTMSPAEAFAAITLAAVAADGYLTDDEALVLSTSLARMQLFRSYPSDVMRKMFDKLGSTLKRQGFDALVKVAINSLPHSLHDTAFAVAADLVLADGEVTTEEEKLLERLCNELDIPSDTARMLVNAMIIKNKG